MAIEKGYQDCAFLCTIIRRTLTDARGLGVGRRPPPGIIPATALAGASRDRAHQRPHPHSKIITLQSLLTTLTRDIGSKTYQPTPPPPTPTNSPLGCLDAELFVCLVSNLRISSYQFSCHNTHFGQHCQDVITCTWFLSHEPNVSKHSCRLSSGVCSHFSLDVLWTSDSRRLLRYKAHKNIEIQKTEFMIRVETVGYTSITYAASLTVTFGYDHYLINLSQWPANNSGHRITFIIHKRASQF